MFRNTNFVRQSFGPSFYGGEKYFEKTLSLAINDGSLDFNREEEISQKEITSSHVPFVTEEKRSKLH